MKRFSIVLASALVSLGVALGAVGVAQANWSDDIRSSDGTVTIAQDETHRGSLYVGAKKLVINGTVTGDVYCAAADVVVTGTVEGDILCATQKLRVDNGTVGGDVRVAAQDVTLEGDFGGSVSTLAQYVRVQDDSNIAKDLNGLGQMTEVDGTVAGSIVSAGQSLMLNGTVQGSVEGSFMALDLGESARVEGDVTYSSSQEYEIANRDRVNGEVTFVQTPQSTEAVEDLAGFVLMLTLAMLLTALVVAAVVPRFVHRASELLRERGLMTVLLGFAVAFGAPIAALFLILTAFLAPLAVIVLLAWLIVSMLSGIFFAYFVGSVLLRGVENIMVRMLGGAVALLVLYLIPFVNIFVLFAAWVVGSGMIVMTLTNGYRRPDYSLVAGTSLTAPAKKRASGKKK